MNISLHILNATFNIRSCILYTALENSPFSSIIQRYLSLPWLSPEPGPWWGGYEQCRERYTILYTVYCILYTVHYIQCTGHYIHSFDELWILWGNSLGSIPTKYNSTAMQNQPTWDSQLHIAVIFELLNIFVWWGRNFYTPHHGFSHTFFFYFTTKTDS